MLAVSFCKGLAIGFSIAAPVGPIGLLCIRRSISHGRWNGLLTGLGAATADAFYGAVAGFGLTLISNFLISQQSLLQLVGGVFLCYLGLKTFFARSGQHAAELPARSGMGAYFSTLLLTLTNPMTILAFAAVFAGLGSSGSYWVATFLVLGVFVGSALWWLVLSMSASLLGARLTKSGMGWVNRLSGSVLAGFGGYALLGMWHSW